jgi:transcriptional regulator with XRE-family HTH domain
LSRGILNNFVFFRKKFNLTQEELSKKIGIKLVSVARYETNQVIPSFKVFLKLITLYGVSLDFLILNEKNNYPKNLKLLRLAKRLDDFKKAEARSNIEATTKNLLGDKINNSSKIKQDIIDIDLSDDFHSNLKNIRKHKQVQQVEIGNAINSARSTVALYEKNSYPQLEKMIKLSEFLNVSIHAMVTGEKLLFDFKDGHFGDTILMADQFLSFEHQKFLIELMENIINQPTQS